ncbi:hypothetical protein ACI8AV_18105 [Geodermatophilus sp. SYSU D00804]
MLQPRRSLVLTRPVGAADVAIRVDGRVATHEEAMAARVFLGERNSRARPVPHPQVRVSITRDAALLEVPAQERDEEGRLVRVVMWLPFAGDAAAEIDSAAEFALEGGRTVDVGLAWSAYDAAVAAHRRRSPDFTELLERFRQFLERAHRRLRTTLGLPPLERSQRELP